MTHKNPENPVISIIVPALNEERYIGNTLRSLNNQQFSYPYEIIVSDGGSTDSTVKQALTLADQVIHNPKVTTASGRNAGAEAAKAPYLVFIDADTIVPPDYLRSIYPIFESHNCDAFCGGFVFDQKTPVTLGIQLYVYFYAMGLDLFRRVPIMGYNFCVHKESFFKVGGFPECFLEDLHISQRFHKEGRVRYYPQIKVTISARRLQRMGFWGVFRYYINRDRLLMRRIPFDKGYALCE
jgi:glycosyltransferase involved in cell wall biosynthesis